MNRVLLVGNAGRDAELRYTGSGKAVANFSVATTYKTQGGEKKTTWHNVTAWGSTADYSAAHVKKGRRLFIEGSLENRKYTDKAGVERQVTEVVAMSILVQASNESNPEANTLPDVRPTIGADDIPF